MKYSVIIPVYNVETYIDRCVMSVIEQAYNDMEIILVDDGSLDGSGQKCDQLKKRYPNMVRVLHQENQGISGARNSGMKIARGEYLFF